MIAIIDYGMGNLGSVAKAFTAIGAKIKVTSKPGDLAKAEKIVLPGVGAFSHTMRSLKKLNLSSALIKSIEDGKPYLGLCLGLQILFEESEEGGRHKGLGILDGKVARFAGPAMKGLKIPQMGWNRLKIKTPQCPLLKDIPDYSWMYFVHSYYVLPREKNIVAAATDYGIDLAAMIWKENIYATQFHPEKSQKLGIKMLENFVKL